MVANIVLIGFVIIFIGVFIWTWKNFFQIVKANTDEIKNINLELNVFDRNNAVKEYQNIERIFKKNNISKKSWEKYSDSLVKIQDDDTGEHQIWATLEADNYFNLANVCESINFGFWQNLGGTFTGIGILGTFVGLSIGVYYINVDDVELMKIGIGNLLNGLSTAFITSLFGISLALFYGVYYKYQTEKLEGEIITIAEKLDDIFPKKVAEQILLEAYKKIEQQTIQFNDFSSQLAISIGDTLANHLEDSSLAQDMSYMRESIQNISDFMLNDLGNVIGNSISENFTSQLEPTFKALNESIAQLGSTGLNALKDTITEGSGAQIDAFSNSLSSISNVMKEASSQMIKTSNTVNSEINETLKTLIQQTNENREALAKSGTDVTDAISVSLEKINKGMEVSVNNAVEKMNIMFTEMAKNTELQQNKIEETNKNINANIQQSMMNMKEQVESLIEKHNDRMLSAQSSIIEFINHAKDGLVENQNALEKLSGAVADIVTKANDTAHVFCNAATPMQRIASSLQDHTDKMADIDREYNEKIQNGIADLKSAVSTNVEGYSSLQTQLSNVLRHWQEYNEQYASEKEAIASIFDNINANLKAYNDGIIDSYKKSLGLYDESMEKAYSGLSAIVGNLNEAIEELSGAR